MFNDYSYSFYKGSFFFASVSAVFALVQVLGIREKNKVSGAVVQWVVGNIRPIRMPTTKYHHNNMSSRYISMMHSCTH